MLNLKNKSTMLNPWNDQVSWIYDQLSWILAWRTLHEKNKKRFSIQFPWQVSPKLDPSQWICAQSSTRTELPTRAGNQLSSDACWKQSTHNDGTVYNVHVVRTGFAYSTSLLPSCTYQCIAGSVVGHFILNPFCKLSLSMLYYSLSTAWKLYLYHSTLCS